MRELNAGGHKLRRPSFSNTLSELPEVEEPETFEDGWNPYLDVDVTSFNVLPPIGDDDITPSPRPRFNTMPEASTKRRRMSIEKTKTTEIDRDFKAMKTGVLQRQQLPGKITKVKRRSSIDMTSQSPSSSSGNSPPNPPVRRHSLTIPSLRRCSGGSGSPRLISSIAANKDNTTTSNSSPSNKSVEKTESLAESVVSREPIAHAGKNHDLVNKWKSALDDFGGSSPYGSFESLSTAMADAIHKNRRRFSMPLDRSWNRRWSNPAFAKTNRRVDLLLEYGKAVRNRYNNIPTENKSPQMKTIRTLADFMIEIPKEPRFSSYMSPEAQYSLMKGYEDKLYRRLSNSVPNDNSLLKRNVTPSNKIEIKPKNTLGFLDDSDEDEDNDDVDEEEEDNENGLRKNGSKKTTSSFLTQMEESVYKSEHEKPRTDSASFHNGSPSITTDSLSMRSDSQTDSDPKTILRSIRRLSISLVKGGSISKHFHDEDEDEEDVCSNFTTRQRSYSLPNMTSQVPFDRRLMMSYRLQSAMDILDNIKSEGDTRLSPRLKVKRGANLAEYNAWVSEWNKEFCVRHGNG